MKNTGGPAFPQSPYLDGPTQEGMTLRDYFAAKAMQGLCGAHDTEGGVDYHEEAVATSAYAMADAMLAERAR